MEIFLYKAFKEQLSLLFETWSYWTWSSGLAWVWIFQSLLSSTGLQAHSTILCLPGIWFLCLCIKHFTSWTISSVCFITFSMIISLLNTCFNYPPPYTPPLTPTTAPYPPTQPFLFSRQSLLWLSWDLLCTPGWPLWQGVIYFCLWIAGIRRCLVLND